LLSKQVADFIGIRTYLFLELHCFFLT
jgi:hypothetical protein